MRATERASERERETEREREREIEGEFCFVFYCLGINELRRRYSANMRTGVRTCTV